MFYLQIRTGKKVHNNEFNKKIRFQSFIFDSNCPKRRKFNTDLNS